MKFEEFEKKIYEKGYGIVDMNHYALNNERFTYCVVLGNKGQKAIKSEGKKSEEVFDNIYNQIISFEKE